MRASLLKGLSILYALVICAVAITMAQAQIPQQIEENTDRKGADLRPPIQVSPSAFNTAESLCASACAAENRCQTWTLVKQDGKCWLKGAIPDAKPDNCCTSGLIIRKFEGNTDRPGNDIAELAGGNVNMPGAEKCQSACEANGNCRAWTFVTPKKASSQIVAYGRCYLKNPIPVARTDKCCISGVVDHQKPPK